MTLEPLVGAQLAVGIPGAEPAAHVIAHLRRIHARHLVVFARNFTHPEQFRSWLRAIEAGVGRRLIVMVDQEGGRVVRLREGVTVFPSAREMAQRGEGAVREQGKTEARELTELRVGLNLAPCADVVVEGSDPIVGDRSYGADPAKAATLACARIRALQSGGVGACAKHFPGLGAVPRDPHKALPTVSLDEAALERHLLPFQEAVAADVMAIMSSHVCYPAWEEKNTPATFSARLIRGLLRERLRFSGLILTDDMEMGALRGYGSVGECAVRAVAAGHDIVLICSDLDAQQEAFQALMQAYAREEISFRQLEATVRRVESFLKKYTPTS